MYITQYNRTHTALLLAESLFFAGDVTIKGGVTFTNNSDLNGASPQFTLTCISTGGPATTVTWSRDSVILLENELTVLDIAETAQYTHVLTVTERLGGFYQCKVSNSKPSVAVANLPVQGKIHYHCIQTNILACNMYKYIGIFKYCQRP